MEVIPVGGLLHIEPAAVDSSASEETNVMRKWFSSSKIDAENDMLTSRNDKSSGDHRRNSFQDVRNSRYPCEEIAKMRSMSDAVCYRDNLSETAEDGDSSKCSDNAISETGEPEEKDFEDAVQETSDVFVDTKETVDHPEPSTKKEVYFSTDVYTKHSLGPLSIIQEDLSAASCTSFITALSSDDNQSSSEKAVVHPKKEPSTHIEEVEVKEEKLSKEEEVEYVTNVEVKEDASLKGIECLTNDRKSALSNTISNATSCAVSNPTDATYLHSSSHHETEHSTDYPVSCPQPSKSVTKHNSRNVNRATPVLNSEALKARFGLRNVAATPTVRKSRLGKTFMARRNKESDKQSGEPNHIVT